MVVDGGGGETLHLQPRLPKCEARSLSGDIGDGRHLTLDREASPEGKINRQLTQT